MIRTIQSEALSESFLIDLYACSLKDEYVASMVCEHLQPKMLPDREFQKVHKVLFDHYKKYKTLPSEGIVSQHLANSRAASELFESMLDNGDSKTNSSELVELLDKYIQKVKLQETIAKIQESFSKYGHEAAIETMKDFVDWSQSHSLTNPDFIDVVAGFDSHFKANRSRHNDMKNKRQVCRFYIDELDSRNGRRNLRGQLSCFLAPSGVGKSHIARWIGKNACQIDGLDVLHIQLEGSEAEVVNAYSASLVGCNSYLYETGMISDEELAQLSASIKDISGHLHVKSYPKFSAQVSTRNIYKAIQDYKKAFKKAPDVVIIDSMDLLTDSTAPRSGEKAERLKRIQVANDLKDIAADEDLWVVVTYQSTIENQEWLNDEKNVLTAYNTSEAKGLCRPLTHLITLNQSSREEKENTMRIHVAKSRFFKKGEAFKIATNYDKEIFYDRARTMRINRIVA